jgi:hypothetical protein
VNNLLKVLSLNEKDLHRVTFVNARNEGGINTIFDPQTEVERYQVFIHNSLPYREIESHEFAQFEEARSYAARLFKDWEMLSWDMKTKRPCEEGGRECGSGDCDTCRSIKEEGGATPFDEANSSGCGTCGGA